jgi:hypothetical protein
MMGGIIDLLALLDGWDYREVSSTITVQPGVINEVFAERVPGWLINALYDSTDAFAHITVNMPPETFNILSLNLTDLAFTGVIQPFAPAMVATLFNFPNLPADSSGLGFAFFDLPYPLPLKKTNVIHVSFTLDPGTTQPFAVVDYDIIFAQIYRMDLFQKSLKDLLNVKKLPVL